MRTSHKAKDAAAGKQSYVCDTFTGHGKAHEPPPPGSPVCLFPVMLLGKAPAADLRPEPARDGAGGRLPGWPGPQSRAQARDSPGCASTALGATLMLWSAAWRRCAPQT
jgi:hypothetical protein